MEATRKMGYYLAFTIDEIGTKNFNSLIRDSLSFSTKLLIDDYLHFEEAPAYKTQVPYFSGYIQDRYAYYVTQRLREYVMTETEAQEAFDLFFCQYVCWDFYNNETLILSINVVQGIVIVNSLAIELNNYENFEGDLDDE